jgi:thiol-disulfide isomerase/thioredoxin
MTADSPQPERRRIQPVLLALLLIPLLGIAGALIVYASGGLNPAPPVPPTPLPVTAQASPLLERAAPNFDLETLYGGSVRLSSLRGRPVFLNFWATWCEPCLRELPAFVDFMAEQPEGGPVILAVNSGEPAARIEAFLAEQGISGIPILLDLDYSVSTAYGADRIPMTFVIDAAGVVREMHVGELKLDDLRAYVEQYGG